ncbi:nuclear transport factor 2 family protein [Flavobacterium sp. SUN046]|uniref:nuclear transport factor 2 family protein n=1 Tax=Flavobacterium sp. SUN046 TaxID=3002440 RepID=UPI002DB67087|nr:nuclear transport factor 2 family protein [Flavobacterium sp. SUN046]MEC4049328.1 nuclear transport factor 2 family protein [Flavobacterium sp. SUN046]
MDIKLFIEDWLNKSNAYDTEKYLELWHDKAVLDDPSVGQVFKGYSGIKKYFESYFIGYKTQTRLINLEIISNNEAHIEVEFTGEFPEGKIGGTFDFTFKEGKIDKAKADLI